MLTDTASTGELFERDPELSALGQTLLAAADEESSVTVVAAPAGMGKTKLLEAAVAQAERAGLRPLVARASELERDFAFGVVRQLFEPAVVRAEESEREQLFAGAARHAGAVLDLDPAAPVDRDPYASLHGLYWLLVNLSGGSPLVVAVDDLQWADEPSLRWLAYAVRRLEGLGVAVVATLRTEEGAARPEEVAAILDEPGTARIEPGPLSVDAVAQILGRDLGRTSSAAFTEACHKHTLGNPFLLSELVTELVAQGIVPSDRRAAELGTIVPERVGETISRQLDRLSPAARALAGAVAVVGEGGDLAIAAELAKLEPARAPEAAMELVDAGILAAASPPRFRHPLLRAAVDANAPASERAAQHATAARLLAERGAPAARIATHLAAGAPGAGDAWAVEQLRAAARSARSQGVPERSTVLLRRALEEPPPPESRGAVLRELGAAELVSFDSAAAEHLAAALELETDPGERADIALGLGLAHYFGSRHADAVEVLMGATEEASGRAELRERWLLLEALLATAGRYDLGTAPSVRGRIGALAEGMPGGTPGERLVRSVAAAESPGPTAADLVRATELEQEGLGAFPWPNPTEGAGVSAMYLHAGRPDAAAELADLMLRKAAEEGSLARHAMAMAGRAVVSLDRGDLRDAAAEFEEFLEGITELGLPRITRSTAGFYVLALCRCGLLDRAADVLVDYEIDGELPELMFFNPALFCRGELRLAQARWADAEADFRELGRRHEQWGMTRPSPPWRSGCALALTPQGRRDEAQQLALAELELTRLWDTPKAIAFTTRALALTHDGEEQIEGLTESARLLEGTPWRYERALTGVDLGAALRRSGRRRDGREALALAMDEAHGCGAEALAERAAEELRASGARPRRRAISGIDALTPSELRVARLASAGGTNREIAQELFVTMATVETHLTRVYRKLDLAGRDGLAAALPGP